MFSEIWAQQWNVAFQILQVVGSNNSSLSLGEVFVQSDKSLETLKGES